MCRTLLKHMPLGLSIVRLLLALRRLISSSVLIGQFPTMKTDADEALSLLELRPVYDESAAFVSELCRMAKGDGHVNQLRP